MNNSCFSCSKIFEVAPTFYMVDIQKAAGDTGEYLKVSFWNLSFVLAIAYT